MTNNKLNLFSKIIALKEDIKGSSKKLSSSALIDSTNGMALFEEIMRKKEQLRTLKIQYAKECHVAKTGVPRSVHPEGKLYATYLPTEKKMRAKSEDDLWLKLFDYYCPELSEQNERKSYSISSIFEDALNEKAKEFGITEISEGTVSSRNTLDRYRQDYRRFITPEFANKDIRKLTPLDVKDYCIDTLNRIRDESGQPVKYKAFKDHFKAVLRLIWGYADKYNICQDFISNANKFNNSDFKKLLDCHKPKAEEKAFSPLQIEQMDAEVQKRITNPEKYGLCYTNGYMFRLSKWTGMRIGELCSLQWEDIDFEKNTIHIHSQQLIDRATKKAEYVPWTKNERGTSRGGREIAIFDQAKQILLELKEKQKIAGIKSKWVFADENGEWIRSDSQYIQFLQRLSKKFGFSITNNHAIRMYFNSYVLIPAGVSLPNRARTMGHTEEENLKFYTFEDRDYVNNVYEKVSAFKPLNNSNIEDNKIDL